MTIHDSHPFADPDPDPVRRLRGRIGGTVTLWTSGGGTSGGGTSGGGASGEAGLTVTSVMVAGGEPGRVLALLDPDADLTLALEETGRAVVHLLQWEHRDLAEMFAGTAPAPGGAFRHGAFEKTSWGPRLVTAATWAGVRLESTTPVGWSVLVTCTLEEVTIGSAEPLVHRRGRYQRPMSEPSG